MPATKPTSAVNAVVSVWVSVAVSVKFANDPPSRPTRRQTPMMSAVTSGPARATLNSWPAVSGSRSSLARPPKNHRSMPVMPMP